MPITTKIILSSHNFSETPPEQELHDLAAAMREAGADIVKIATTAKDICDSAKVLSLLQRKTGVWLCMWLCGWLCGCGVAHAPMRGSSITLAIGESAKKGRARQCIPFSAGNRHAHGERNLTFCCP